MGNRYSEEHEMEPITIAGVRSPGLVQVKAYNRTPRGLELTEWAKMKNARKRARRARKGK